MDVNNGTMAGTGGGIGSGIMIYDRIHEYPIKYESDYTIDINAKKGGLSIQALFKSGSKGQFTISKK